MGVGVSGGFDIIMGKWPVVESIKDGEVMGYGLFRMKLELGFMRKPIETLNY